MRGEPKWAQILWEDTRDYLIDEPAITALVAAGAIVEEENQFMVAFSNVSETALGAASEASKIRKEKRYRQGTCHYRDCSTATRSTGVAVVCLPLPFETSVCHVISHRENMGSRGRNHIQVLEDVSCGRLHRKKFDTLCKGIGKFWGLKDVEDHQEVSCLRCLEIAQRILSKTTQDVEQPARAEGVLKCQSTKSLTEV